MVRGVCPSQPAGFHDWASPSALPVRRGFQQGDGVLPAAVVMPRSRQVYSSPVQNACSFMALGRGQRPRRPGSRGSGPRCSQTSRVQGGCGCQRGALVPRGPAVPNQFQPLQPGGGVNRTHLPAGCLCLCQALSLIITPEKGPLCFQQLPWPQWQPEIRSIRAGLEAGSLELAISCFWLGGGSRPRSQPRLFRPGQLRASPTWTSGRGAGEAVSGVARVQGERCVSESTARTPFEKVLSSHFFLVYVA